MVQVNRLIINQKLKLLMKLIISKNLVIHFLNIALTSKEKHLKKKMTEYNDLKSRQNLDKLSSEINSVHDIMKDNIDLLLERDSSLQDMGIKSSKLS